MKGNYLKSYFKSFGVVSFLVVLLAYIGLGYLAFIPNGIIENVQFLKLIKGGLVMLSLCIFVIGLSALKSEKVSFIDLFRIEGLLANIGIVGLLLYKGVDFHSKKQALLLIGFAGIAFLLLIQVIIRFVYCHEASETSLKGYFGALVRKYNPLVFIFGSAIVSALLFVVFKGDVLEKVLGAGFKIASYKVIFLGALAACMVAAFIPAFDSKQDVCLSDFVCAFGFMTTLFTFLTSVQYFDKKQESFGMLLALFLAFMVCLIGRALTYSKPAKEENPKKKTSTYFKRVYERFDAVFQYLIGAVVIACITLPFIINQKNYLYTNIIEKVFRKIHPGLVNPENLSKVIFIFGVGAMVISLIVFLVILFGKNKKSENVERVDAPLIPGIIVLASLLPIAFMVLSYKPTIAEVFDFLNKNVILYGALGFALLLGIESLVVLCIRLRSFKPAYALEALETEEAEEVAEETTEAEAMEEEAIEPVEEESQWTEEETELVEEPVEEEAEEVAEETPEETEEVAEETTPEEAEEVAEETPEEALETEEEEEAEEESEEEAEEESEEAEDEEEEAEEVKTSVANKPLKAEPKKPSLILSDPVLDNEGKAKKIKRKFNTKMMYAPYETKEYYSEVKNYLMMYKAKGRCSSRCETFRHKGLVAKVALGGKAIKVYLALDTAIIESEPRYHLKDCSEKKQYAETPVMIKVKSARSLKYFKELVDMLMQQKEVKPKRNFKPVDYTLELIPNGEAILGNLGMSQDYLQETMNARGIPAEMPDNLIDYIPVMADEAINDEIIETSIYLDTLCSHFEDGDVITLETLKELHIINRGNVLRIKARGTLDRKLTIYADKFDDDALKMMMCTNCTAVRIVRE